MGSKRLKAFVVRGTQKIALADPERFAALRKAYLQSVKETDHPVVTILKNWGTCGFTTGSIVSGDAPIKNWTLYGKEGLPNHEKIGGDEVIKYQVEKHACRGCPIGCKGWGRVEKDPYAVSKGSKLEYETITMLGSSCLIDDVEALNKANDMCNRYGLDTIGTGATVAFAMECYEFGAITKKDTGGIEPRWGNADAMIALVEKIGRREGFGAVLADGTKLAAVRIGKGSEKWAMHIGGQDVPAHDPRVSIGYGWGYVCDPTPGRHTASLVKHLHDSQLTFVTPNNMAFPKTDPLDVEANAQIYATCSDFDRLWTSLGLCVFGLVPETLPLFEVIAAVTGWDFTPAEGLKAGRRIQTLRQAFNFREGVCPGEWRLPERLMAVQDTGQFAGKKVDFQAMKEKGYAALGWDSKTGRPLESSLKELGLKALVGRLP